MSLDVQFAIRKNVICPHCGKLVKVEQEDYVGSGGRGWYPILKDLGYYVPYKERTEENDWYGKDMVLTPEQLDMVYQFIKKNPDLYEASFLLGFMAMALHEKLTVVVNADW